LAPRKRTSRESDPNGDQQEWRSARAFVAEHSQLTQRHSVIGVEMLASEEMGVELEEKHVLRGVS
jgi:hypothetical protein